jgi:hypothetical protein
MAENMGKAGFMGAENKMYLIIHLGSLFFCSNNS